MALPTQTEEGTGQTSRRRPASARVASERVHEFVAELLGDDLHAARVVSFASGVVGVLQAAALGVHAIGRGLADAMGLDQKRVSKQIDRLLSNTGISVLPWTEQWVPKLKNHWSLATDRNVLDSFEGMVRIMNQFMAIRSVALKRAARRGNA